MEATLLQDTSKQLCPFLLWCNQHLCQNDEVVKPAYYSKKPAAEMIQVGSKLPETLPLHLS